MQKLTMVIPYYRSRAIIGRKFEEWKAYEDIVKKNLEIVVVDDGSPAGEAFIEHWQDNDLDIKLFKIKVDIPWNECGASNLGCLKASNQWILRTDVDWWIPNDVLKYFITEELDDQSYYIFPAKHLDGSNATNPYNIYAMTKEMFWKIGGYDEKCRGNYGCDLTFRYRVDRVLNIKQVFMKNLYIYAHLGASDNHGLVRNATWCRYYLQKCIDENTLFPDKHINFEYEQLK